MNFDTILFFAGAINILFLIIILHKETYLWKFESNTKLGLYIKKIQKKGKVCKGKISYPSKEDFKQFKVKRKSDFLVFQNFYRIIICENNGIEKRCFLEVRVNIFIVNHKIYKMTTSSSAT